MALISPILDNRSYEDLREELLRRIPVFTPTWTDHNESDPGIVLLELVAYLGESLLYRFNQIPETTRIEFLRLLGVQPRAARPARVLLAATTEEPRGVQVLKDAEAMAGSLPFTTEDEVFVWPLEAVGAGKEPTAPQAGKAGQERKDDALARADLAEGEAAFYATRLTPADPTSPDAAPIDVSKQVDRALWVALLGKATTDRQALSRRTLFLGVAFDEQLERPFALERRNPDPSDLFASSVLTDPPPPTLWRLWTGASGPSGSAFVPLRVLGDTTRGMVTTGVVKLELPDPFPRLEVAADGLADSPPPLDDEKLRERVVGWLQVTRPAGTDIGDTIRRVRWVGANAVSAVQSRTPPPELVGTGTGDPDQRFPLAHPHVLPGSVTLQVEEPAGWTDWHEVDTFATSTAEDRHYVVDADHGAVAFGRARMPQLGERIRVLTYRYGGGAAGNVPAKAVTTLPSAPAVTVSNPLPAVGGSDAVDLAEALDAIPAEVHRRDRAVVPEDYRALALQVSGVRRAEVLPLFHPDTPGVQAAGVTSVVVLPEEDQRDPDAPLPDLGLLRRVAAYLDARRLVTAELYVIPPEYVRVAVSVGVAVRDGYQVDAVRRWVEQVVRQYLAAVPPAGPDGEGWPLGREVRAAELEAVAVQVEGVEYAVATRLATVDPAVQERDLVTLDTWQLPQVVDVTVVEGPPPAPGTELAPDAPAKVPVPLPPEVC